MGFRFRRNKWYLTSETPIDTMKLLCAEFDFKYINSTVKTRIFSFAEYNFSVITRHNGNTKNKEKSESFWR